MQWWAFAFAGPQNLGALPELAVDSEAYMKYKYVCWHKGLI